MIHLPAAWLSVLVSVRPSNQCEGHFVQIRVPALRKCDETRKKMTKLQGKENHGLVLYHTNALPVT